MNKTQKVLLGFLFLLLVVLIYFMAKLVAEDVFHIYFPLVIGTAIGLLSDIADLLEATRKEGK